MWQQLKKLVLHPLSHTKAQGNFWKLLHSPMPTDAVCDPRLVKTKGDMQPLSPPFLTGEDLLYKDNKQLLPQVSKKYTALFFIPSYMYKYTVATLLVTSLPTAKIGSAHSLTSQNLPPISKILFPAGRVTHILCVQRRKEARAWEFHEGLHTAQGWLTLSNDNCR